MPISQVLSSDAFSAIHRVHVQNHLIQRVNGSVDITSMPRLRNGVHVTNRKTNRRRSRIDRRQHRRHGIRPRVSSS